MGIEHKHAYRFVYLRSEKWDSVRLEALLREKASCQICGAESISNDAHHIFYPQSVWETQESDLVILCRHCHNLVHKIFTIKKCKKESLEDFMQLVTAIVIWNRENRGVHRHVKIPIKTKNRLKGYKYRYDGPCCVCPDSSKKAEDLNMVERYPQIPTPWIWRMCADCKQLAILTIKWPDSHSKVHGILRKWLSEQRRKLNPTPDCPEPQHGLD